MAKHTNRAPEMDDAPIQYPAGSVVGIVNTADQLESVIEALTGGGFLRPEIAIIYGEAAAERLNASTGRTGFTDIAMRLAAALGMPDDETMLKESYEQALRDGHFVVLVLAPTEDRKKLAAQLLERDGGHFVNFLGRFTIEALVRRSPAS